MGCACAALAKLTATTSERVAALRKEAQEKPRETERPRKLVYQANSECYSTRAHTHTHTHTHTQMHTHRQIHTHEAASYLERSPEEEEKKHSTAFTYSRVAKGSIRAANLALANAAIATAARGTGSATLSTTAGRSGR
jgi:hypothetical protein